MIFTRKIPPPIEKYNPTDVDSGGAGEAREAAGSVRGGAGRVPESTNMSGPLTVLSLLAQGTPGRPRDTILGKRFFLPDSDFIMKISST